MLALMATIFYFFNDPKSSFTNHSVNPNSVFPVFNTGVKYKNTQNEADVNATVLNRYYLIITPQLIYVINFFISPLIQAHSITKYATFKWSQ